MDNQQYYIFNKQKSLKCVLWINNKNSIECILGQFQEKLGKGAVLENKQSSTRNIQPLLGFPLNIPQI